MTEIKSEIMKIPFLRITIPFMVGIVLADYFVMPWWLVALALALFMSLTYLFRASQYKNLAAVLLLLFMGFGVAQINRTKQSLPQNVPLQANLEIDNVPYGVAGNRWTKSTARVHNYAVLDNKQDKLHWKNSRETIIIYLDSCYKYDVGEVISARIHISPITHSGNTDNSYSKFMRIKGFTGRAYIADGAVVSKSDQARESIFYKAKKLQKRLSMKFANTSLSEQDRYVLSALITGDRHGIDQETMNNYSRAGVTHILALSGLHLSMIFFILNILLKPLSLNRKYGYLIKTALIITLIWGYTLMTGLSLSICRAALMLTVLQISLFLGSRNSTYNALFVAAFITLVIAPSALYDISFQLSYLAVISIIFFYPRIHRIFRPPIKPMRWVWNVAAVGVAAQIGVIPLIIYYFNHLPILSMFVNPMIMLTSPMIMAAGTIYLLFSGVVITDIITETFIGFLFAIQTNAINFTSSLSFAVIDNIELSKTGVILCYALIICGMIVIKMYENRKKPITVREVLTPNVKNVENDQ